ncbi:MAG: Uridine kinase [uncultured Acidimicrobiales bacterium]|uniref:Uridine kinase n=1 Tax=uncultured Acidimicrobiales bacterium TaxID=310071 RepID=A0A6J4JHG4_9ACTN|nr:MAG: Uridine kinase [uncultured Acidimicrobiales bacterium]
MLVPAKGIATQRALRDGDRRRPVMLAIAGDSASGKTTLTKGLVQALGPNRVTAVCVDDYHRYDRAERKKVPFTPLHPDCNYMDVMEQHLQLLALGHPILKPVYGHSTGTLDRPELIEPREFVIIEGLLPLHTRLSQACFDIKVYLDPPEEIRRGWKIRRDTRDRGYTEAQVLADLDRREPESAAFIRPQRRDADIVVRFAPIEERGETRDDPLSVQLLLRPTIAHPDLVTILQDVPRQAMHLKLVRDENNRPVDALHIHAYADPDVSRQVERAIWKEVMGTDDGERPVPKSLGEIGDGPRLEPLALTQLLLLHHMLNVAHSRNGDDGMSSNGRSAVSPGVEPDLTLT